MLAWVVLGAALAVPEDTDFALFWTSEYSETGEVSVPVEGQLPRWVRGTLYRNGPGRFEFPKRRVTHQFDGMAKLYKFRLDGERNAGFYATKFLKTQAYNDSIAAGDVMMKMTMYPVRPPIPFEERMKRAVTAADDNTLINVWKTGDHLFATSDQAVGVEFDPVSLDTVGHGPPIQGVDYNKLKTLMSAAHPARPKGTENTVNYLLSPNPLTGHGQLQLYEDTPDMQRRIIGSVNLPYMTVMHSFPVTEHYVAVVCPPLHMVIADFLTGKTSYGSGALHWYPNDNTTLHVFDRRQTNAAPVGTFQLPAFYANHQVNAWETTNAQGQPVVNID